MPRRAFRVRHNILMVLVACLALFAEPAQTFTIAGGPDLDNPNFRIAIVGADPAGLHMAQKIMGFTQNVTIFERKSPLENVIDLRGAVHELGNAMMLGFDYMQEPIISVAREIQRMGLIQKLPSEIIGQPFVWFDGRPLGFGNFLISDILMKTLGVRSGTDSQIMMVDRLLNDALNNYTQLLETLDVESFLYGNRSWTKDFEMNFALWGTLNDFLNRHGLQLLEPFFRYYLTAYGVGNLEKFAAVYAVSLVPPSLVRRVLNGVYTSAYNSGFAYFDIGLTGFLHKVIQAYDLPVTFQQEVIRVRRVENTVRLTIKDLVSNTVYESTYDFLIWSPEMRTSIERFDSNYWEYNYFTTQKSFWISRSLVHSLGVQRGENPIDMWITNSSSVTSQFDSYGVKTFFRDARLLYKSKALPTGNDTLPFLLSIISQFDDTEDSLRWPENFDTMNNIQKTLQAMGATTMVVLAEAKNRFFPHYDYGAIISNNRLFNIFQMQGRYRTWYIGSSVSMPAVKFELNYNLKLLSDWLGITVT